MNEYRDVGLTKKMERKTGLAGLPRDKRSLTREKGQRTLL